MNLLAVLMEQSSQSLDLFQTLRAEKNRRFVSGFLKGEVL